MNDSINRQAAIDALYHVDEYNGRSVEAIRNLPSAEPEIIHCKECKHWMRAYLDISGKFGCNIMRDYTAPNDYCFKAERKE